ncbi:tetratricopeptide repeat protein [Nitzschia inconspicua]|uniref:Tetratricopeptide repeat protein n=1 Tax=Nitzschia inconspicua TaxID=303405 RepID=A0A9K3P7Q9_9STRA|nr:tetratricopeptide repeat protein [Nitzschia inconspicua]
MSTSAPVSSSSSSSSSSSHKTTSATTTTTTTTTTSTMQYASNLCSQGRSAWQQQRYVEALEHFGTAVRLLESSLGGYHPLVAKTYYWIGFIYKHSLTNTTTTTTSSTTTTTSDNSTTSSTAAVDVQYLLLALAAFTKNVSINQDGGVVPNKAIQEAKQAIQWVIRAIQERYNNNNNMNNMNNNPSIQEETTNVTLSSTDPDTSFSNSSQKSIYLTTTTWQQYQTYQQLVLGTKLSHGHNEKNDATDNNNNNNDTTTDDGLYLTALEDSIRLEAKGDTLLRQYQYGTALELYQASMDSFPDPHHAALWGNVPFVIISCIYKN